MYAREVEGRALNFAVSGLLWNRSLVMRDEETGTLWSHLLGQGMMGALKDAKLEIIPSQMTDWKTWVTQHPETTVIKLSRTSHAYQLEFYQDPALFVLGIRVGMLSKAWTFDRLASDRVVNDEVGDLPVVLFFDPNRLTAVAYERRVGEETLEFRIHDGGIIDSKEGASWNGLKGESIGGPTAVRRLTPIPAIVSGLVPWVTFHPDTEGLSEEAISHAKANDYLRPRRRGLRR